jgi:membrane dipeptidase
MNELGMVIDVAHMSHMGAMEVIQYSQQPLINSHSNARSVHSHARNARDEFLQSLPDNGGVIGLSVYNGFVADDINHTTREQFFAHVDHVINLIGSEHLALGTDFHGIPCSRAVEVYQSVAALTRLANDLADRYAYSVAERICHQNAKRVMQSVLSS